MNKLVLFFIIGVANCLSNRGYDDNFFAIDVPEDDVEAIDPNTAPPHTAVARMARFIVHNSGSISN